MNTVPYTPFMDQLQGLAMAGAWAAIETPAERPNVWSGVLCV